MRIAENNPGNGALVTSHDGKLLLFLHLLKFPFSYVSSREIYNQRSNDKQDYYRQCIKPRNPHINHCIQS